MKRLLFLSVGPFYFPKQISIVDRFTLLSQRYCGEIFAVVNDASLRRIEVAQFRVTGLVLLATIRHPTLRRGVLSCGFAVATALYRHYFKHKYDAIVASDSLVAGPIALIIGWLTGAKSVIEVKGQYESSFRLDGAEVSRKQRLKEQCAKRIRQFVVRHASVVRLLYPDQLRRHAVGRPRGNCVSFPELFPLRGSRAMVRTGAISCLSDIPGI